MEIKQKFIVGGKEIEITILDEITSTVPNRKENHFLAYMENPSAVFMGSIHTYHGLESSPADALGLLLLDASEYINCGNSDDYVDTHCPGLRYSHTTRILDAVRSAADFANSAGLTVSEMDEWRAANP